MFEQVFKNYEAFYNMVLSTTILTNKLNEQFEKDATQIIDFIGNAYGLDEGLIEQCKKLILNDLMSISLISDATALYSRRTFEVECLEVDALYDIKCDVLSKLDSMFKDNTLLQKDINPSWFDFHHYKSYEPYVRFRKINFTSGVGDPICTKQAGIMKILGIGTKIDIEEGIKRLLQSAFWGDISSIKFVAYVYKQQENEDKCKLFTQLATLCDKYLLLGKTELDDDIKKDYMEAATSYYSIIASIKQDIILRFSVYDIDFSFVEVVLKKSLQFKQIMKYINEYREGKWKEETNSSYSSETRIGFSI